MGFGHRVYKNYDPRARIIQQHMDEVFEATEYNPLVEIARELEKRALDDDFFTSRKLYPNVDFYSGIIYEALEIPTNMFTVIFAIPRTAGWVAQWMEMKDDPEQKIARPRQIYTGEREREYVAVGEREGPEKIVGPPAQAAETAAARRLNAAARPARCDSCDESMGSRRKLTVRHGSDVDAARFEDLDEAVAAMRRAGAGDPGRGAGEAGRRRSGTSGREDQVHARLQLSGGGCCASRSPGSTCGATATFVPYRGGVRREELDPTGHETPFDAVRETLAATRR